MPKPPASSSRPTARVNSPLPIRQHADLAARSLGLPPRVHHERVVHGHAHDLVDTLGLHALRPGHEAGQMLHRAGGVNAPAREEDDAFPP